MSPVLTIARERLNICEVTYAELFRVLDEAGLSPERAAQRLGVSNMTLRRWRDKPQGDELPKMYERSFGPALQELIGEGKVSAKSAAAKSVGEGQAESFLATLKRLGFPENILSAGPGDRKAFVDGLAKVGDDKDRKKEVDRSKKKIGAFASWGKDWKARIDGMLKVIRSEKLTTTDKLVAYGALFYLISPIDLIPDTIPVIGYLDDFAVLGMALWYYKRRFPDLFKAEKKDD